MTILDSVTRVRVHGPSGHLDVAVPNDLSVAELVVLLVQEMGESGDRRWLLEDPVAGPLRREATLASCRILDGASLLLRPRASDNETPHVDNVAETMTAARGEPASGGVMRLCASVVCLALPAFGVVLSLTVVRPGEGKLGVLVAWIAAALSASMTRVRSSIERPASVAVFVAISGAASAHVAMSASVTTSAAIFLTSLGVLIAAIAASALLNGSSFARVVGPAAGLAAGFGGLALYGAHQGLAAPAAAAAIVVCALVLHDSASRLALRTSGLARLDDRHNAGAPIARAEVSAALKLARLDVATSSAVSSTAAAIGAGVTAAVGAWGLAFGLCACAVVVLRARLFVHPEHVAAGLLPGLCGAAFCLTRAPSLRENALAAVVLLAVLAVVVPAVAYRWPSNPVSMSRTRVWASIIETTCAVALAPLAIPATGLAHLASELVR